MRHASDCRCADCIDRENRSHIQSGSAGEAPEAFELLESGLPLPAFLQNGQGWYSREQMKAALSRQAPAAPAEADLRFAPSIGLTPPQKELQRQQWQRFEAERVALSRQAPAAPAEALHPTTANLVDRFAAALREKLASAEKKYGYSDGWLSPDWMDECRAKLMEHIAKGDPRDVAAYCAFLWHHGEPTASAAKELPGYLKKAKAEVSGRFAHYHSVMGNTTTTPAEPAKTEAVHGERFVRAWLQLDQLPGGMMIGPEGKFGPVPASTSCWVTTSERERDRLLANGESMLEVWTTTPPTPEAEPVQQDTKGDVISDGDYARMAEAAGATVGWGDDGAPPVFRSWGAWGRFCDAIRAAAPQAPSGQQAEPTAQWEDPRVQTVYSILCSEEAPPPEQHWEGWTARRIVDALAGQQSERPAPAILAHEAALSGEYHKGYLQGQREARIALAAATKTPEPAPAGQAVGEREPWLPYLSDRADGVKGRYAIARWNPAGYREVWNLCRHEWGAFSDEVLTLEEARALLKTATLAASQAERPAVKDDDGQT